MDLYIKDNDNFIKLKEIETINDNSNCLIFILKYPLRKCETVMMEQDLTIKTGKQCIVLGPIVDKVVGV